MIKWLKSLSRQEKVMVVLIVVLIVGIILRWGYIKEEVPKAFDRKDRTEEPVADTTR